MPARSANLQDSLYHAKAWRTKPLARNAVALAGLRRASSMATAGGVAPASNRSQRQRAEAKYGAALAVSGASAVPGRITTAIGMCLTRSCQWRQR